jgi:hypothetical protein
MAGLRTSLTPFQWFASTLLTALTTTPPTFQKHADKPLRTSLLSKLPVRSASTAAHRTTNRCVAARNCTFHLSRGDGLSCSLFSPMFPLMGREMLRDSAGTGGIFSHAHFLPPICTPISVSQVQHSPASGAMRLREVTMNSEQQERAMNCE